jgi:hypothetical protein
MQRRKEERRKGERFINTLQAVIRKLSWMAARYLSTYRKSAAEREAKGDCAIPLPMDFKMPITTFVVSTNVLVNMSGLPLESQLFILYNVTTSSFIS